LDIVYSAYGGLIAVGAMTTERRFAIPMGEQVTGVRFRPGMARALLRIQADELTNGIVPLDSILGWIAREASSRLADQSTGTACAGLLRSLLHPVETKNPVQRAIEFATVHHGVVDLDWVARQANLSPRQFRRRCIEESGLGPKLLFRILRFRHARERAIASRPRRASWADIAAESGYCDQAHLIRDFHQFTGRSPMAVLSNI
jgi:AraC-like DNA-binding protein